MWSLGVHNIELLQSKRDKISEETSSLRAGLSKKSFSCLIRQRWKKVDLATDFICGLRKSEKSKVKLKQ